MSDACVAQLVYSRDFSDFEDVVGELAPAFGDRFPDSIKNWCGIGSRPYPLPFWRVYLITVGGEHAGVAGLYRRDKDPADECWVGWFGLRRRFRGRGCAAAAIRALLELARIEGFRRIRVYTAADNESAIKVYERAGFKVEGQKHAATGRSADPDGVVLSAILDRRIG